METRQCKKCGVTKPLDQFARSRGKYENRCKKCRTANSKAWRDANLDRQRAAIKAWAERNPERVSANRKAFYDANRDREREQMRAWKAANPERRRALNKRYTDANPAEVRAYKLQYQRTHKDAWRQDAEKRRARQRNAPVIEKVNRQRVIDRDHSICWLCGEYCPPGRDLTLDHVIPLTKGGHHTEANLRVAHRRCNARKGTRILT